jgi:hypothetical protein
VKRRDADDGLGLSDIVAIAGSAILGAAVGFVISEELGRVNSRRIRRVYGQLRAPGAAPDATLWSAEDAERLEAAVLDALNRQVVLARRAIRVNVLGLGLVELTGRVAHTSEVALAGDVVQEVEGVDTVLNHLLVEGVDETTVSVPGPSAPRAARG